MLAGAGTGKTGVITAKIAHLIANCGVSAQRVYAITFTNKAAREMRSRVRKLVGPDGAEVNLSTFHSLGLRILREHPEAANRRRNFSIFDTRDQQAVLKRVLPSGVPQSIPKRVLNIISSWKSQGYPSPPGAEDAVASLAAETWADYQAELVRFNAVDFDDLIALPAQLLADDQALGDHWRAQVGHLLVDEYQDTNLAQFALLRVLLDQRASLTAVGDDDQSIYAFRGACAEVIDRLAETWPTLRVIKLERNYRCPKGVLDAANALIDRNPHTHRKTLWSDIDDREAIRVWRPGNYREEAERLAVDMQYRHRQQQLPWSSFAVLYRRNAQARAIEQVLRAHDIPYQLSGGRSFFDRAEIKDLLAYLRLAVNPGDDAALLRCINTPTRGMGASSLQKLATLAANRGSSLLSALRASLTGDLLIAAGKRGAVEFVSLIDRIDRAQTSRQALRTAIVGSDYQRFLADKSAKGGAASGGELLIALDEWLQSFEQRGVTKLSDVLAKITLAGNEDERGGDLVRLSTLHAAKGLEYHHVYLIGLVEGVLPHESALAEDGEEEERRLAYVGLTRARQVLTLSAPKRDDQGNSLESSRFIDEIPSRLLQIEGQDRAADKAERKQRGADQLAQLQRMLVNR